MSRSTSALLLSPGSDHSDSDYEARTTQILSMAMLDRAHNSGGRKFAGLESPEALRYMPSVALKPGEAKRFSLASNSSSEGWDALGVGTPDYKSALPRYQDRAFSVSLVSDSPSDAMSPMEGAKSQTLWETTMGQDVPSTPGLTTAHLSSWSTMTVSTPSVSSSTENTQTITWSATTPFKAALSSASTLHHKENMSPNTITFATTPKVAAPRTQFDTPVSPAQTAWNSFPSASPHTVTSPTSYSTSTIIARASEATPTSTSRGLNVSKEKSPSTHVGCLVDINGSFTQEAELLEDECTRTIRMEVQREMASLAEGLVISTLASDSTLPSSRSPAPPFASTASPIDVSPIMATSPVTEPRRTSLVQQQQHSDVAHASPSTEFSIEELQDGGKELANVEEAESAIASVMRGETIVMEAWLSNVRPIMSLEDVLSALGATYDLKESQVSLIQEAVESMAERGELEALEFATAELEASDFVRVYRPTDALFGVEMVQQS